MRRSEEGNLVNHFVGRKALHGMAFWVSGLEKVKKVIDVVHLGEEAYWPEERPLALLDEE